MGTGFLRFIPESASTMAPSVDLFFLFMIVVSGFFSLLIAGLIVYFALRYREGRPGALEEAKAAVAQSHGSGTMVLEIVWTAIPFGIAMVMFAWGTTLYFDLARPPGDVLQMYVVGKQWMWKIQHPEGPREINEIHVPTGKPVRLTMASEDVIHSFFIPAFRVKQDVVPGRYTQLWFEATKPGTYHLFCAEYCGTQHSGMIGHVVVMEPKDYEAWLGGGVPGQSLAQAGEKLFAERACNTCHLPNGEGRGPSLVGVFGSPVKLEGGGSVIADEGYVRESILTPAAKIVAGYQPLMPTQQGLISEEQLVELVAYIKSLSPKGQPGASPAAQAAKE